MIEILGQSQQNPGCLFTNSLGDILPPFAHGEAVIFTINIWVAFPYMFHSEIVCYQVI